MRPGSAARHGSSAGGGAIRVRAAWHGMALQPDAVRPPRSARAFARHANRLGERAAVRGVAPCVARGIGAAPSGRPNRTAACAEPAPTPSGLSSRVCVCDRARHHEDAPGERAAGGRLGKWCRAGGRTGKARRSTPESADRPARAAPPAEPDERRAGRRSDAGRPDRRRPPPSVPAGRPDWPSRPAISINRRNDSWKPTFSTPCARRAAKARRTAACTASRRSRSPQPRCARFATATVSTRAPSTTSCSAASSPSASKARASAASRCLRPATRKPRPACRSTASAHRASRRATWPPRR